MEETLHIELEDAASGSWWARILHTLGSQYGRTQLRFVGESDANQRLYVSDTFPGPPWGLPLPKSNGRREWRQAWPTFASG